MKQKIVCAHLYNDYSGSPLVLSTVIKSFITEGKEVALISSSQTEGFLSNLDIRYHNNSYRFFNNKYARLFLFILCQVKMFFQTLRYINQDVIIYVNTLLPFGVALAGKLMGKRVIYHLHETSLRPLSLKRFLKWVVAETATEVIYVSNFLRKTEKIKNVSGHVIYNSLSEEFVEIAESYDRDVVTVKTFRVLMLCSLKAYKGVNEFVQLASQLVDLKFDLVLNADQAEIDAYFSDTKLPANLKIYPSQSNVHRFFLRADLVVNLSHPEEWVETFGMTLLEGMQYGVPAIAPPVGGPTELVLPGINGYLVDPRDIRKLVNQIRKIAADYGFYEVLSENAKIMASKFTVQRMRTKLMSVINKTPVKTPARSEHLITA